MLQKITFITGNAKKAEYLEKYLGFPVAHEKLDLDEIQSLDLREIVEHKAKQAYEKIGSPVLVEDVSLEFTALGRLPGPFNKFFIEEIGVEGMTNLLKGQDRRAIARCTFGYSHGRELRFFDGHIDGTVAETPRGSGGFGWDQIFIPYFTNKISAELSPEEYERFYTEIKPLEQVREFLLGKYS